MPGHFVAFPAVRSEMLAQVFGVDVGLGAAADSAGNGMDAIDAGNGMMHKEYSFYNDSNEKTETHTHTQKNASGRFPRFFHVFGMPPVNGYCTADLQRFYVLSVPERADSHTSGPHVELKIGRFTEKVNTFKKNKG